MSDKPYGEVLDEMDHEAKYLPAGNLLDEILVTLRHARVFIKTREKMHPEGVRQYDDLIDRLHALVSGSGERGNG